MKTLVVFAKEPVSGEVKTRLKGCLSDEDVLRLYKAMLKDTFKIVKKVRCENKVLAFCARNRPEYLIKAGSGLNLYKQKGRSLGERMHNAFVFSRKNGASKTVIIGSDAPVLSAGMIEQAFIKLDKHDAVIGPAFDGGYYLIGLNAPCKGLFKDITWSSAVVLQETIKNAGRLKKRVALLGKRYDIDDAQSLFRLRNDLSGSKDKSSAVWTKEFLKELASKRKG